MRSDFMEKVKLTKEQANAIEWALQKENEYSPDRLLRLRSSDNANFHNELYPLNDIDIAVLARALYIGYEVEPEFKVGDWVVYKHNNTIWEIIGELYGGKVHYDITRGGKYKGSVHKDHIRLATPEEIEKEKERRWWAKHGREVWELREGDLLERLNASTIIEFLRFDQGALEYRIQNSYYREDILGYTKRYRVICFAEDRKDIGDN